MRVPESCFCSRVVLMVAVLTALLLLLSGAHGRLLVPSAEAVTAHDVEPSPPRRREDGDGRYYYYQALNKRHGERERAGAGRWRRVQEQDVSESKRRVPQGPNPLHN
ncbi:hypothetical protein BS78_01G510100 [Paspalum vaginatum]|nr:hypothetical protein BS78_01G510100 [Paspalum vaginatum]